MAIKWSELKETRYPGIRKRPGDGALVIRVKTKSGQNGGCNYRYRVLQHCNLMQASTDRAALMKEMTETQEKVYAGETLTLTDYAKRWVVQKQNEGVRPNTLGHYINVLSNYILPLLGEYRPAAITPKIIRQWQYSVDGLRTPEGESYSRWTVSGWVSVLRNVMKDMVVELGLKVDPSLGLKRVSKPKSPKANRVLNSEQLRLFLTAMKENHPEHYAITLILVVYGFRWGEASALHLEHIDKASMEIRVVQSHVRRRLARTKTESHRYLPLLPDVLQVLEEHTALLAKSNNPGLERGILFPSSKGSYRLPGSCVKAWRCASESLGLDWHLTAHDLRRTCQNLLRISGVGLSVQQAVLGHSSMQMTEHYSQVCTDEKRRATAGLMCLVNGEKQERG